MMLKWKALLRALRHGELHGPLKHDAIRMRARRLRRNRQRNPKYTGRRE